MKRKNEENIDGRMREILHVTKECISESEKLREMGNGFFKKFKVSDLQALDEDLDIQKENERITNALSAISYYEQAYEAAPMHADPDNHISARKNLAIVNYELATMTSFVELTTCAGVEDKFLTALMNFRFILLCGSDFKSKKYMNDIKTRIQVLLAELESFYLLNYDDCQLYIVDDDIYNNILQSDDFSPLLRVILANIFLSKSLLQNFKTFPNSKKDVNSILDDNLALVASDISSLCRYNISAIKNYLFVTFNNGSYRKAVLHWLTGINFLAKHAGNIHPFEWFKPLLSCLCLLTEEYVNKGFKEHDLKLILSIADCVKPQLCVDGSSLVGCIINLVLSEVWIKLQELSALDATALKKLLALNPEALSFETLPSASKFLGTCALQIVRPIDEEDEEDINVRALSNICKSITNLPVDNKKFMKIATVDSVRNSLYTGVRIYSYLFETTSHVDPTQWTLNLYKNTNLLMDSILQLNENYNNELRLKFSKLENLVHSCSLPGYVACMIRLILAEKMSEDSKFNQGYDSWERVSTILEKQKTIIEEIIFLKSKLMNSLPERCFPTSTRPGKYSSFTSSNNVSNTGEKLISLSIGDYWKKLNERVENLQRKREVSAIRVEATKCIAPAAKLIADFKEEGFNYDVVVSAIELLRSAIHVAKGNARSLKDDPDTFDLLEPIDLESIARAKAYMGHLYGLIGRYCIDDSYTSTQRRADLQFGRQLIRECIDLVEGSLRHGKYDEVPLFYSQNWYIQAIHDIADFPNAYSRHDDEISELLRRPIIAKLQSKLDEIHKVLNTKRTSRTKLIVLIEYLYNHHKPVIRNQNLKSELNYNKKDLNLVLKASKEALVKYSVDQPQNKQNGEEWEVFCQEIFKLITDLRSEMTYSSDDNILSSSDSVSSSIVEDGSDNNEVYCDYIGLKGSTPCLNISVWCCINQKCKKHFCEDHAPDEDKIMTTICPFCLYNQVQYTSAQFVPVPRPAVIPSVEYEALPVRGKIPAHESIGALWFAEEHRWYEGNIVMVSVTDTVIQGARFNHTIKCYDDNKLYNFHGTLENYSHTWILLSRKIK